MNDIITVCLACSGSIPDIAFVGATIKITGVWHDETPDCKITHERDD
jgi:hypothetical protein